MPSRTARTRSQKKCKWFSAPPPMALKGRPVHLRTCTHTPVIMERRFPKGSNWSLRGIPWHCCSREAANSGSARVLCQQRAHGSWAFTSSGHYGIFGRKARGRQSKLANTSKMSRTQATVGKGGKLGKLIGEDADSQIKEGGNKQVKSRKSIQSPHVRMFGVCGCIDVC